MDRDAFSSHCRYHPPKKRTTVSYQNPTLQTPSSPKYPGTDVGEDLHHQKPHGITIEHDHKPLLPPYDEADHDTSISHRLIGSYHYDTCMYLCPYTPHRRCRGVGQGQPLTDPSPGTIPSIYSPFPVLSTSFTPPFKFTQESLFFFLYDTDDTCHGMFSPLFVSPQICFYEWSVDGSAKKLPVLVTLLTHISLHYVLQSVYAPPRPWEVVGSVFTQAHTEAKVPPGTNTPVARLSWQTGLSGPPRSGYDPKMSETGKPPRDP